MSVWQNDTTSYFSVSLKFGACCISRSVVGVQNENNTLNFNLVFCYFFVVFVIKLHFITFFDELPNFCNRILTSQKHELVVSNCQWNCVYCKLL